MSVPLSRRRFLTTSGGLAATGALFAACGGSSGSSGSGSGGSPVTYWSAFTSKTDQSYVQTNTIDAFSKAHKPGVTLSVKQTSTIDQLIQTSLASGRGPDVIPSDGPTLVVQYADAGNVLDLTAYAEKYKWSTKVAAWALETGMVGGKLYGLPTSAESVVLLYNPKTFQTNGWSVPTDKAGFEKICEDAKSKGMMPIAAGNADFRQATEWHVTAFLNQVAGNDAVHSALTGKKKWTDPAFVNSITLLKSYFDKGWYGSGSQSYFTNKFADLYAKLASGKAAMMITGSWGFTEIQPYFGKAAGNTATWDWAPLPLLSTTATPGSFVLAIGGDNSINSKSKNPDAAAEFLDWTLDPARATKAVAEVAFQLPPINVKASDFPSSVDERLKRFYVDLSATKSVGYATWSSFPPKTDTYIYTSMDKVITGNLTPQAYCAGLDAVFAPELTAGKVPPLSSPLSAS